jgi:hypothetical protein
MREMYIVCALALCFSAGTAFNENISKAGIGMHRQESAVPGTRCTRLRYEPKATTNEKARAPVDSAGQPGARCFRLTREPLTGDEFLPNTPPKVGLSSSTSYLAPEAVGQVKLKTIACDLESDNLLYTYSVTAGRLTGDGANAVWDLNGVSRPGEYLVSVEVDDGCGCISFANATVVVGEVK